MIVFFIDKEDERKNEGIAFFSYWDKWFFNALLFSPTGINEFSMLSNL